MFVGLVCDQYEILWCKFPKEIYNWLNILRHKVWIRCHGRIIKNWNTDNLATLHRLYIKITKVVDYWVQPTLEGYIIEFVMENHYSFVYLRLKHSHVKQCIRTT